MITPEMILNCLMGKSGMDSLILTLGFEDYPAVKERYDRAVRALETASDNPTAPAVRQAVETQAAAILGFCCWLGVMANRDHFLDPAARTFLEEEPEAYLREKEWKSLSEYKRAQTVLDRFRSGLSTAQRALYEDVTEYICYLKTVLPKLGHYCGYLLGNDHLHRVIPGYRPDPVLDIRYRLALANYFGVDSRVFTDGAGSVSA